MTPHVVTLLAIVLLAAGATSSAAQAVEPSPCPYVSCAVRHTVGFSGERLVRGEGSTALMKINFSGSNAADFLARVESAAGPARDFRARRTRASMLGIVAGAATGYFFARGYGSGDGSIEANLTSADYAVLVGGIAASIWGGIEATRSRNSLSRAIWEFNRAPLL